MNIYDVYITKIFTVDNIEYKPHYVTINHAKFTRTTLVLRKEKNGNVRYYDILTDRYIKSDLSNCKIGDEVIGIEKMYVNFANYIGYSGSSNISKRKIKNLIKKNAHENNKK